MGDHHRSLRCRWRNLGVRIYIFRRGAYGYGDWRSRDLLDRNWRDASQHFKLRQCPPLMLRWPNRLLGAACRKAAAPLSSRCLNVVETVSPRAPMEEQPGRSMPVWM